MNVGFFGCSFTEGGGLNSPVFNKYAIKHNLLPKKYEGKCDEVMKDYRFSTLVGRKLNCKVTNYGKSGSNNESIINTLYENLEKHDVCIVQISILSRKEIYDCESNEFFSVTGEDSNAPNNVIQYWLKTITEHYNEDYELKKIGMLIKLFSNFKQNIFWMFHESVPKSVKNNKNLILFDGNCLGEYCDLNKLLLTYETGGFYDDRHYSLEGNKIISNKIVEFINDKKY